MIQTLPIPQHIKEQAFAEIDRVYAASNDEADRELLTQIRQENQQKYDEAYRRVIARCNRITAECKQWKREAYERKVNRW